MATYNRSNVLRYSIKSVLDQTLADWELLVIGDCCTDDTEEVVASFKDDRISFYNLPENIGEQSGPNNEGVSRARGKYIAFLNHDDLWFPDHLEDCVKEIEKSGADLIYSYIAAFLADGRLVLLCVTEDGRYEPQVGVPASSWLLKRELAEEVGPWRSCMDIYYAPSQDWLYRAQKAGKALQHVPRVSVLLIPSGERMNSYKNRDYEENKYYSEQMSTNPVFREELLMQIARSHVAEVSSLRFWPALRRVIRILFVRLGQILRIHPHSIYSFFRYRRKGAYLQTLRKNRGLEPIQKK